MPGTPTRRGRKRPDPPPVERVIAHLLHDSKRTGKAAPLRHLFVQREDRSPAVLARFVKAGALRALQQYLLLVALATAEPFTVGRSAIVWHRALGFPETTSPSATVSKNWRWLADERLISTGRRGRLSEPKLLREDASGEPYTPPDGKRRADRYFTIPFEYWLDDPAWYRELSLPEVAMLLVALSQPDDFILPLDKVPAWYGISRDTARRGLRGLYQRDVLTRRIGWKETNFVEGFYAEERFYTLAKPFGPKGRKATHREAGQA